MIDDGYHRRLVDAELVLPDGYAKGIVAWRERGLAAVDLMIERFRTALAVPADAVVEHDFLMPAGPYRAIFGDYSNMYGCTVDGEEFLLRPDNMCASVGQIEKSGSAAPVVAVGGLLRTLSGGAQPLFRDRYIWPSVQVTDLVGGARVDSALVRHQAALTTLFEAVALPTVSVRTSLLGGYGKRCLLAVSCLPDGRPTVLSTTYVMAEGYREAFGVDQEVIDVGFTGKVLALAAMHHWDRRGLALPSTVAPVQVGVLAGEQADHDALGRWREHLEAAGLRLELVPTAAARYRRSRAERRLHRLGVPLVVGVGLPGGGVRLTTRGPVRRIDLTALPEPDVILAELSNHDRRLRIRADACFDRGLEDTGLLLGVCQGCADSMSPPVFGWCAPDRRAPCATCGEPGMVALVDDRGRFY